MFKKSYHQGGEQADKEAKSKRPYKAEPALVMQPRYKELFYRNYDLYESQGVDGKAKHGSGEGYHAMQSYKSVQDFLKAKREKSKTKYKSDDSYKLDSGKVVKARIDFLKTFIKTALDFINNESFHAMIPDLETNTMPSAGISAGVGAGTNDYTYTKNDFENKGPDSLNIGRDYTEQTDGEYLDYLSNLIHSKYNKADEDLTPKEPSLYGLPDGIEPKEDLDYVQEHRNDYGVMNSGTNIYDNSWK